MSVYMRHKRGAGSTVKSFLPPPSGVKMAKNMADQVNFFKKDFSFYETHAIIISEWMYPLYMRRV